MILGNPELLPAIVLLAFVGCRSSPREPGTRDASPNFIIVFCDDLGYGDNGAARNWGGGNLPLRGFKGSAWEGRMRVPCAMRWPLSPNRLADVNAVLTGEALQRIRDIGQDFLGKHYDPYFEWSDERVYCSELMGTSIDHN